MNTTTSQVAESSTPDLPPLYRAYLSAFNAHSWPLLAPHLSPNCHCTIRGKLMDTSAELMRPNYEKDFARCDKHNVVIREIEQIERTSNGEEEEWKRDVRWGVRVVLFDDVMGRVLTVRYWYGLEERRWVQVWHEIVDCVVEGKERV